MWHERPGTQLVQPQDSAFWEGLWKTQAFRDVLNDPMTGYKHLLGTARHRPWWFVDAQMPYERYHFSIWLGDVFLRREYDNPVITDMYYWHDLVHALTFRRIDPSRVDEQGWRLAMRANEIAVSIETEMLIYLRAPHLRAHSFTDRIWIDDLTDPLPSGLESRLTDYRQRLADEPEFAFQEAQLREALPSHWPLFHPMSALQQGRPFRWFWDLRRAVTINPDPDNAVEVALHRYEQQAMPFYKKWSGHWDEVELDRARFAMLCEQGNWEQAVMERHQRWEERADENGVPYGMLAPRPKKKAA